MVIERQCLSSFESRTRIFSGALVLCLARRRSGLTLSELGELVGGIAHKTVFARVKYMEKRLGKDTKLRSLYEQCKGRLSIVEI